MIYSDEVNAKAEVIIKMSKIAAHKMCRELTNIKYHRNEDNNAKHVVEGKSEIHDRHQQVNDCRCNAVKNISLYYLYSIHTVTQYSVDL